MCIAKRFFRRTKDLERLEIQDEFKQILEFAIQRGNEDTNITVQEFVNELAIQLKTLLEKTKA